MDPPGNRVTTCEMICPTGVWFRNEKRFSIGVAACSFLVSGEHGLTPRLIIARAVNSILFSLGNMSRVAE